MDSISITLSKNSVFESTSMLHAAMNDAASQLADGTEPSAISNEEISSGDKFLGIYKVTSDAFRGGMGSRRPCFPR